MPPLARLPARLKALLALLVAAPLVAFGLAGFDRTTDRDRPREAPVIIGEVGSDTSPRPPGEAPAGGAGILGRSATESGTRDDEDERDGRADRDDGDDRPFRVVTPAPQDLDGEDDRDDEDDREDRDEDDDDDEGGRDDD